MDELLRANWILPFQWLPAEDRGPRFLEWIEDVEAKFELVDWPEETGEVKKRKAFLAIGGADIRSKVGTLASTGTEYGTLITKLKEDLLRDEPLVFLISQAMDLKQEEQEGIDDFAMRARKKQQRINWEDVKAKYNMNNLMTSVTITRGTMSANIREYSLSQRGVPDLDDVLARGRSRESMRQHNKEMIGNTDTSGREITLKSEPTFAVKGRYGKYSGRYELEKNQREIFEASKKCKFCGFDWPHPKGQVSCPAWGKECHKCSQKNHFARCCRNEAREKRKQKSVRATWRSCESSESESEDEFIGQINKFGTGMHERVIVKVRGRPINFIVDTGSSSVIMTKQAYLELIKENEEISLGKTKVKLMPYGSNNALKLMGKFKAMIEYEDKQIEETIYVVDTPEKQKKCSLLSKRAAERLGIITFNTNRERVLCIGQEETDVSPKLKKILAEYEDRFHGVGTLKDRDGKIKYVKIQVDPLVKPVAQRYRPPPIHLEDKLLKELDKWEHKEATETGPIIEEIPEDEPTTWLSNLVVTPKKLKPGQDIKDLEVRPSVDMRCANKAVLSTKYHIPAILEVRRKLQKAGARRFSKLDIHKGYLNMALHPDSREITTHHTPRGPRRFTRMNYGTKSAAEIFQKEISEALGGLKGVLNISDDILVYGKDEEEHDNHVEDVLKRCRERDIRLGPEKCEFNCAELTYFGYVLSGDGMKPDPRKVTTLKDAQPPQNTSELRSFLGMAGYSSPFIPKFSEKTAKLRELLVDTEYRWTLEHQKAFDELKECLSSETTLAYYVPGSETELVVDGSQDGLGAILAQKDPATNKFRPVAYSSRACTETEKRYSQIERECLAATWGVEKNQHYLIGGRFNLITDHQPLVSLLNNPLKNAPLRIERMRVKLMGFDFVVKYRPGKNNPADWGSRHPDMQTLEDDQEVEVYVNMVTELKKIKATTLEEVRRETEDDELLKRVMHAVKTKETPTKDPDMQSYVSVMDELSVINGLLLRGERLVVPRNLQQKIVDAAHEGHQGITKTKNFLRSRLWFPGMDAMVERTVRGCMSCQVATPQTSRMPLKMTPLPAETMEKISTDFYGPLPTGEYLLLVTCKYSRFPFIEMVTSTAAKAVIPKFEKLFSEFGYPMEITAYNGPPFRSQEFKEYAAECGFTVRNITPAEPKANGQAERFMKNIAKAIQTAIADKRDWKKQLMVFLRNYRATPHQTTGKAPAELMFPNRNFKTKVPTVKPTTPYHHDRELREQDWKRKQKMKMYADSKRYVKEHKVHLGDAVLVPQRKRNKFTTPYHHEKYVVTKIKGSMITARNQHGHTVTRDASKMKKIQESPSVELSELNNNRHELGSDDDEADERIQEEVPEASQLREETSQPREEIRQPLRRSNRVRSSTMNTKYRDYEGQS